MLLIDQKVAHYGDQLSSHNTLARKRLSKRPTHIVFGGHAQLALLVRIYREQGVTMRLKDEWKQEGAMGYLLLWLLGIPIPVLLLIFLLRGCT
jgi:hypothetical protein